jgi:hypothetical protein
MWYLVRMAVMLGVTAGCAADGPTRSDTSSARDSAGVRMVESSAPAWDSAAAWRLGAEPSLDFGPGESLYQIGTAIRLASGRMIVAHNSANEILIYSPAGELVKRFGKEGSGPGEFREISRLFTIGDGDSILVYDLPQFRATVFDTLGTLVRSFSPAPVQAGKPSFVSGVFTDGSLLIQSLTVTTPETRGLIRPPRSLWRSSPDSAAAVHILDMPGEQSFWQDSPFGPVDRRRPFFGHSSSYAAWRDRLYTAATDTFEIRVHSAAGRLLSIIRKQHEYIRVSEGDVDRLITRQLASVADPAAQQQARRMLDNLPIAERAPAFGWPVSATRYGQELQVDADGNLWVVEYFMPDQPRNARIVFDSTGVWLGSVTLPDRFAPTHIGSDFMLGTWTDSMDVEHVRLYPLIKRSR